MFIRSLAGVTAVVALFAAGCGAEDPAPNLTPGGSGGIVGHQGGSGGGGSGGVGGTGGVVLPEPVCGDGVVEGEEACDDGEANSDNAADACRTDCTEARCGDGVEDTGETCDDGNTAGGDGCSASCRLEYTCGDGLREFTEECDGADLAGQSCADFGHNSGTLACATDCTFDSSACATVEICGNGVDDDGDLAVDCEDTDCASDPVACPTCGDGVINVDGEGCDGEDLGGASCTSLGFASGTLSCSEVCVLDSTACVAFEDCATPGDEDGNGLADCDDPACAETFECPTCGNGIIQQGEQCEGAPPPQANCLDNGFDAGTMSCDPVTCKISTANCRDFICGDGAVEGTEECDDGNTVAGDGCTGCMIDGDTCANPLVIGPTAFDPVTRVWTVNGSTTPMSSTYGSATCGVSGGERDMVLEFTAPETGEYALDLEFVPYQDDMLYVWDGTCGTGAEILCSDPGTGTLRLTAGQTVFLVVDGYGSSGDDDHGPFVLTIAQTSACGNGVLEGAEYCDFSDVLAGDGCSPTCQLEDGWACTATSCWQTVCGDGNIEGTETCEDGNTVPNDGCTNCKLDGDTCANPLVVTPSYRDLTTGIWTVSASTTPMNPTYAAATCGSSAGERDMVVEFTAPAAGTYEFDLEFVPFMDEMLYIWDGTCGTGTEILCNDYPGIGTLTMTAGQTVYVVVDGYGSSGDNDHGPFRLLIKPPVACGDGFTNGTETCDVGTNVNAACVACQLQPGFACDSTTCWPSVCGDGTTEGFEQCDDGNSTPSDGCTNCLLDGDSCATPLIVNPSYRDPVTGTWTISGSTTPMSSTYGSSTCGVSSSERDMVLQFTAPIAGDYSIDLEFVPWMDEMLYVWDGVCQTGTEILCSDAGTGTLTLTAGQIIFIVVDGYGSTSDDDYGPFVLTVDGPASCGDGFTQVGETCDTGTTTVVGCTACQLQLGYACNASSCWTTTCGDGVIEGLENCEDGNSAPGDGCDANCMIEVVPEVEPNGTIATATPLALTDLGTGAVSPALEADYWAIPVVAGTSYTIEVSRHIDGSCGQTFPYDDPGMELYDPAGTFLVYDDDSGQGYCPLITFTATATGTYYANVTSGTWAEQVPTYYIWVY